MKKNKKQAKIIIASLVLIRVIISYVHGPIQFVNLTIENWSSFCLDLLLVIFIAYLIGINWKKIYGWILVIISLPVFLLYFLLAVISFGGFFDETLQEIKFEDSALMVYRTNCGATCSFGILVRTEKKFFFGMLQKVNIIQYYDKAYDIKLEKISDSEVKVVDVDFYKERSDNSGKTPQVGDVWKINE